jgi:hypothetical protein
MKTTAKEGGPAFPTKVTSIDNQASDGSYQTGDFEWQMPGMTLRDYFAAAALQGIVAHLGIAKSAWDTIMPDTNADLAYKMADAMLEVREGD